jgi:hypothetical protein
MRSQRSIEQQKGTLRIQFPRLLAEIHALIEPELVEELANAMDLDAARVYELFERATEEFERIKPPAGEF